MASYEEVGPPGQVFNPPLARPRGPPPADRRPALTGHLPASFLPVRQRPFRPNEVTGVAVGIFLQIVLMLRLGLPERSDRCHLGDNLARPKAGSIDIGDSVFGDPLLLVIRIEDGRPVARAPVVALTVQRARIVDLEKEFQELAVTDDLRI